MNEDDTIPILHILSTNEDDDDETIESIYNRCGLLAIMIFT